MAYKFDFPPSSHVHLILHVCYLNKVIGDEFRFQNIFSKLYGKEKVIVEAKYSFKHRSSNYEIEKL